ncbi:hypothetical protein Slin15195_G125020 [Septoria linicola]|uniref:Uncharacterized protein n=1 Tax=Septoria linicola TaxID=215465 RepID=A0A9Q9B575_9PEZI|nr:hypothetical protein Slin14017_G081210 [Septoria linicola]USW59183.1 hypothetical protein Slin15195_G125020 [Septoria linicola]
MHLKFDYPGFYMAGEGIREQLMNIVTDWRGPPTSPGCAMWEIVFYILRDATKTPIKPNTLLASAASVLKQYIDSPGMRNKFDKEARNQSSGHIPKSLVQVKNPYDSEWTAELWQAFLEEHDSGWEIDARVASSGASQLTLYNRQTNDEEFELLTTLAGQFWRIWDHATFLPVVRYEDSSTHHVESVDSECVKLTGSDGVEVTIPCPISIKALGFRGYEKVRLAVAKEFLPHILEEYR